MAELALAWPRPDEIMQIARTRELTPDEMLALQSASFTGPILLSRVCRGKDESDKSEPIGDTYNWLRAMDNIEDGTGLDQDKKLGIERTRFAVAEICRNGLERIDECISGPIRDVSAKLVGGARDEGERLFGEQFGRGAVARQYASFKPQVRKAIDYAVGRMATGMNAFLERGEIQTEKQLKDYCFYVAGSIGEFLNELVKTEDGVDLDNKSAANFGGFLQLVNILKGVRGDFSEGRSFLPAEWHPGIAHRYLVDGMGCDAQDARTNVFDNMLRLARGNIEDAANYVASIPDKLTGYRSFCLVPLVLGIETLDTMRRAGAEEVFRGEKAAIKVPHGIETVMGFARGMVSNRRYAEWINKFKNNSAEFSFKTEDYARWSPEWLRG